MANPETIADLTRSIEELACRSKKPQELEGILAEARVLVQVLKIKEPSGCRRPLFDDTISSLSLLLAGLVVALRREHHLVERIRQHFPGVLDRLNQISSYEDAAKLALNWEGAQPKPTPGEVYERKRAASHRPGIGLIQQQFGVVPHSFSGFSPLLSESPPDCLDKILRRGRVSMLYLEELFGFGHDRFPKNLNGRRDRRYDFRDVFKIMKALLSDRRRKKRGRPRELWLDKPDDPELTTRVLNAIEQRMNSLSVREEIRGKFLSVVRRKAI